VYFTVLGQANEGSGWKCYTHKENLNKDCSAEVWIEVGISVRWDIEMTYNFGNIDVTID
jgi:hypothetical protein